MSQTLDRTLFPIFCDCQWILILGNEIISIHLISNSFIIIIILNFMSPPACMYNHIFDAGEKIGDIWIKIIFNSSSLIQIACIYSL